MSDRNWEAEMAKIDKQLASVSDDQLVADRKTVQTGGASAGTKPSASAAAAPARMASTPTQGSWRSWLKVILAIVAAGGLMYWPWPLRCGLPVVGFTAATGGVALLGFWSAFGSWRHRLGLAHVVSLLVIVWGLGLGAREVLPRTGYAIPTLERPGQWTCEGLPPLPVIPAGLPSAVPTAIPNVVPQSPPNSQPPEGDVTVPPASVPIGPPRA